MRKLWIIFLLAQLCFCYEDNHIRVDSNQSRKIRTRLGLGAPYSISGVEPPKEQWFDQLLDHFRPTEDRTWKQRYWVNDTFYKPGGPAFLMIGGEGTANPIWMVTGTWIKYAEEFGAICFQLEHRYYGESHPTEDLGVKNLVWLSSEQALADLANFISSMNSNYNLSETNWIAFGGSYPGSLAAWLRLKYPHLVEGSVSSSGPLVARADFPEYLEVVSTALDTTNANCKPAIQDGLTRATRLLQHPMGWKLLTQTFKLCNPLNGTNLNDVSNLFESIIGNFEDVVQYNRDNRDFEGIPTANITIDTVCDLMTTEGTSSFSGLAKVNSLLLDATNQTCLSFSYDDMITDLRKKDWNSSAAVGGRQWIYQTCTEFGWYQSSEQNGHPYTNLFPVDFFEKQCIDIFGPKFNTQNLQKGIDRTNRMYGGTNIKVSNVVFVHGSFDPWHALGVYTDISPDATAILIPATSHCAILYPARDEDPPQLKQARETVKSKIQKWISKKWTKKASQTAEFKTSINLENIGSFFNNLKRKFEN